MQAGTDAFPRDLTLSKGPERFPGPDAHAEPDRYLEAAPTKTALLLKPPRLANGSTTWWRTDHGKTATPSRQAGGTTTTGPRTSLFVAKGPEGSNGIFMNTYAVVADADSPCSDRAKH